MRAARRTVRSRSAAVIFSSTATAARAAGPSSPRAATARRRVYRSSCCAAARRASSAEMAGGPISSNASAAYHRTQRFSSARATAKGSTAATASSAPARPIQRKTAAAPRRTLGLLEDNPSASVGTIPRDSAASACTAGSSSCMALPSPSIFATLSNAASTASRPAAVSARAASCRATASGPLRSRAISWPAVCTLGVVSPCGASGFAGNPRTASVAAMPTANRMATEAKAQMSSRRPCEGGSELGACCGRTAGLGPYG